MVKISKIYTRTGDDGSTGLVGGQRTRKDSRRVTAFGDVDELNACIGMARTIAERKKARPIIAMLARVQNELFDLGAELATPGGSTWTNPHPITAEHPKQMESWIDDLVRGIPELRSFVLPGGTDLNATLHLSRTICRRAERSVIALSEDESVRSEVRVYLNRLSDLLFAMARRESFSTKTPEYLWQPGEARPKVASHVRERDPKARRRR